MIDNKKIEEAANIHRFELIASMHGSTLGTPMQCFEEVVDAKLPDIDELIKKLASDEFIEKKIKDILGDNNVDGNEE